MEQCTETSIKITMWKAKVKGSDRGVKCPGYTPTSEQIDLQPCQSYAGVPLAPCALTTEFLLERPPD